MAIPGAVISAVRFFRCVLWMNDTLYYSKVSEEMNKNCPARITTVQPSTLNLCAKVWQCPELQIRWQRETDDVSCQEPIILRAVVRLANNMSNTLLKLYFYMFYELMQYNGAASVVCPSVRPSVCLQTYCASRFFYETNGSIATKRAHDGLQVSAHPGCAQGQGHGHVTYTITQKSIASSSTLMAASWPNSVFP